MKNNTRGKARIGAFLCQCGNKIDGAVDLNHLQQAVEQNPLIAQAKILPYACMAPGMQAIRDKVVENSLDRLIIAGCESRLLLKKFETNLADLGLEQGQIEMVNLRDHVALGNEGEPAELADKGAKLISAAAAGLDVLVPSPKVPVSCDGPVLIVGGGIATYAAAQELARNEIETLISVYTEDPEDEIRMMHEHYPGERQYHDRLREMVREVFESPYVKRLSVGELEKVTGRTGAYEVRFAAEGDKLPKNVQCGLIIAALDGQMLNQGSDFGHDGERVLCQTELEEHMWLHGAPDGKIVFWVNDLETPDRPWAPLAAKSAWNMARHIKEHARFTDVSILYNSSMQLPLTATERALARTLKVNLVPYEATVSPSVQNGFVTFTRPDDMIEDELPWDKLCLSPLRNPGVEALKTAKILGLDVHEEHFLERNPQMVRPEQVGQSEKFLAGSARRPCDLQESLNQGRRAADRVVEIIKMAQAGELFAPRMVCSVDTSKCIGCGLCNEICDCGGIGQFEGQGGNIPREVDPMVCTGGGTCAAACPYHALVLQNNTTDMREARIAALARSASPTDVLGFGCSWGGGAAADLAGLKGLKHDRRFHMLPIGCIGQLDPRVMGRAFLEGAPGLLLIGCPPENCHHSYGLDHTWSRVNLIKKLFSLAGIERQRITLAHADLNQPERFIKTVNTFVSEIDRLGPLSRQEESLDKLQAVYDTLDVPRVRWVLGAGLRRPYEDHYPSDQRNALAFDETVLEVLTEEYHRIRVINLLKKTQRKMQVQEISDAIDADAYAVSHCLRDLSAEKAVSLIYMDRSAYYFVQ